MIHEPWKEAWQKAMKEKEEEISKLHTNSSHGKIGEGFLRYIEEMGTPEKEIKIETIKDPVIEMLKEKFDERSQVGINKYGTTLAENNDDDFLMHLLEELMDASAYIMKIISERNNSK
jgi:hypothetical protein